MCHKSILCLCKSNCFMPATLSNLLIFSRVGLELSSKIVPAPHASTWHTLAANHSFPPWCLKERSVASQRESRKRRDTGMKEDFTVQRWDRRTGGDGGAGRQSVRRAVRSYVDRFLVFIFNRGRWKAVMVSTSKKRKWGRWKRTKGRDGI